MRFAPDQAAQFLVTSMGLSLGADDVTVLTERTEGWIAGLQMAALSLRAQPGEWVAQRVRGLAGTQRYILDYLVEEVLDCQPAAIQSFLLQTSVPDRFCGSLCDAVLESPVAAGSQAILEYLERSNLFVVPLDDERRWYRYHHLFADLLRARLPAMYGQSVPAIHRRAADWFEATAVAAHDDGLLSEAVSHALAGGDAERAASLIERHARRLLGHGDISLMKCIDSLPGELVRSRMWLLIWQSWLYQLTYQLDAASGHRLRGLRYARTCMLE